MDIDARLTHERVRFDQSTDTHLVVTLKAPALDGQVKRPRICVVPVIDVSGSMQENNKLDYAKKSVLKLIDHLKDDDYAGVVVFDECARVIGKPGKLTGDHRERLRKAVSELQVGGYTNFADGMLTALKLVNQMDLADGVVNRIIMFTDGQANRGPATSGPEIVKLLEANMGAATASAFGYGADASQDVLADFSRAGKGNYAFVKDPDAALTAFGKELGGLLSSYGTDIILEVEPQAGHKITSVVSDIEAEEDVVGHVTIRIPEILAEEQRHVVLAVKLAQQKTGGPRAVNAFTIRAHYDVIDRDHHKDRKNVEGKGKAQFVKEGEEQSEPNKELDAIVSLAQVVRAQIEAEDKAKSGKYVDAQHIMAAVAANAASRGHDHTSRLAMNVGDRLGGEAVYAASGGYLRGVSTGGTRGMGVSSYDPAAQVDLMAAGVSLCNSTQTSTSASFGGGQSVVDMTGAPVAGVVTGNAINLGHVNPAIAAWVNTNSSNILGPFSAMPGWSPSAPLLAAPPTSEHKVEKKGDEESRANAVHKAIKQKTKSKKW